MEQDFLEQTKGREIDLVVCSDAEQILGIGDQGVGVRIQLASIMFVYPPILFVILGHWGKSSLA
jgi:hypothetical protein